MKNGRVSDGRKLLVDLESSKGVLRLDLEDYNPEHGDPSWDIAVYGEKPSIPPDRKPIVRMFDTPTISILRDAAMGLCPANSQMIENLTIGWTSIPIMNACAIRRGDSLAIALNIRLSNVILPSSAILLQMIQALAKKDENKVQDAVQRISHLLSYANHDRFDLAVAEVQPFKSFDDFRVAVRFTEPLMLFVLLHEVAHIVLGHLDREELWIGHPLTDENVLFFSSSLNAEYEADQFAFDALLNESTWPAIRRSVPTGELDLFMEATSVSDWLIPTLMTSLFTWFHLLSRSEWEGYYSIPRTHPHPFDRIDRLLLAVERNSFYHYNQVSSISSILRKVFA